MPYKICEMRAPYFQRNHFPSCHPLISVKVRELLVVIISSIKITPVARMASGILFQSRGAALENTFSPCVRSRHRGTSSRWASAERSARVGSWRISRSHVCMMQLVRECFETSTVTIHTRSAVWSEASEDWLKQQWCGRVSSFWLWTGQQRVELFRVW